MKLRTQIKKAIEYQPAGQLFNAKDIAPPGAEPMDISKSLSLYYRQGLIQKLTKGLYYKPRTSSINGKPLPPSFNTVLEKLREVQNASVWYITGVTAYSSLLITYQMSTEIDIATDKPRSSITFAGTTLNFVKSRITTVVKSPKLAQMLDALNDIKSIPDASPKHICERVSGILKSLNPSEIRTLLKYVAFYPPRVKALLGLCFDMAGNLALAQLMQNTLRAETPYKVGLNTRELPISLDWNIQ